MVNIGKLEPANTIIETLSPFKLFINWPNSNFAFFNLEGATSSASMLTDVSIAITKSMPLLSTCLTLVPICGPEAAKPKNIVPVMINLFFHFKLIINIINKHYQLLFYLNLVKEKTCFLFEKNKKSIKLLKETKKLINRKF